MADMLVLELQDNRLTGNIPTQLTALTKMFYFDISHNSLSKATGIPTILGAWGKIIADNR